ncbi:hypothetical protein R3I93_007637 [Phoxinus phoxinus]|uniref:Natural killer cell receptor 2B4 immunoglobulin domain-containing protein n=1 Tax=Phoxinus phoxinus TaxID=58324 RepID=A0AAN9D897_9TELE
MAVNHLLVSFLFLLTFKTGFSAEIPVFVKTGDSVQLDTEQTQKLPEFDDLFWRNDTSDIVKYISGKKVLVYPSFKDRVDFNAESFSLTLKNMQKTDSGLYTAKTTLNVDTITVTYRVSVIDAVDSPVLTENTHWSSSDSCTVNFTCRAHDLTINSSYPNNSCSPEEVTSQNNTLILHCSEESIICNHSNTVSWKIDRINITQLCVKGNDKTNLPLQTWKYILVAVLVVLAVAVVCLLAFAVYRWKCKKGAQEADSTVYAQVETLQMQKNNSDGHTYDVPERVKDQTQEQTGDNRPNTTYHTVGKHQQPADPVETDHTIYSTVCKQPTKKPTKKPPTISSDDA